MSIHRRDTRFKPRWKDIYDPKPQVPRISKGYMSMAIPMDVFVDNRGRLLDGLQNVAPYGLAIIQSERPRLCNINGSFLQDPFFFWAFGCQEPGAMGVIDVPNKKSYIVVKRPCKEDLLWNGIGPVSRSDLEERYLVNGIWYVDELEFFLNYLKAHCVCKEILIMADQKRELPKFLSDSDSSKLYPVIRNLMVQKTKKEIEILLYVTKVLESAIVHIIKRMKAGSSSHQIEAWFKFFLTYKSGFDQLSFSIYRGKDILKFPSSKGLPVLSKGFNTFEAGDVCVLDARGAYFGYSVQIGASIPVSMTFSKEQTSVYTLVLKTRLRIKQELRAGAPLDYIQKMAERCLIEIMLDDGEMLFGTVDGAFNAGVGRLLIPQRVVSSLDVGCEDLTHLEAGRLYLIQIGCYFSKRSMDAAFKTDRLKCYLRRELRQFEDLYIKVSDPVLITLHGFNFLSSIPRASSVIAGLKEEGCLKRRQSIIEAEMINSWVSPSSFEL